MCVCAQTFCGLSFWMASAMEMSLSQTQQTEQNAARMRTGERKGHQRHPNSCQGVDCGKLGINEKHALEIGSCNLHSLLLLWLLLLRQCVRTCGFFLSLIRRHSAIHAVVVRCHRLPECRACSLQLQRRRLLLLLQLFFRPCMRACE